MVNKVLLLDFDGVLSPGRYFSEIYAEKFGVDINKLLPFFNQLKDSTNVGQSDLKEHLVNVLEDWEWKGTVDELLDFWFNADSDIDEEVVEFAKNLQKDGWKVYLATDQEKYRTKFIWEERGLGDWMDGKFVSCELGYLKDDPRFFESIISTLQVEPQDIIFFDDSKSKVDAAKRAGVPAVLYNSINDLRSYFAK